MQKSLQILSILLMIVSFSSDVKSNDKQPNFNGLALPFSSSSDLGVSPKGLDRITKLLQGYIDKEKLPSIMAMISYKGKIVYWNAMGLRDIEANDPLERDDIFRIYSMTKPITSTAIMMLVERGKISLDDPVSKFIPAFSNLNVMAEDGTTKPAKRQITIKHLLNHTSGLTYGFFGNTKVDKIYRSEKIFSSENLNKFVNKVATLPLLADPGERWNYSVSTDILGYIVQIVSEKPFDIFLKEEIFLPLGMDDTAFLVPKEKLNRFVSLYHIKDDELQVKDSYRNSKYLDKPMIVSGGGGLVSTASDYIRFAQMLLQGGKLDGVRILLPKTVLSMRSNQLNGIMTPISIEGWIPPAYGFGLGFATLVDQSLTTDPDHNGVFRWAGVANTFFWIDPEAELIAMVWTQMEPFLIYSLENEFQKHVYRAIQNSLEKKE